jgi:hypothetical protein
VTHYEECEDGELLNVVEVVCPHESLQAQVDALAREYEKLGDGYLTTIGVAKRLRSLRNGKGDG